MPPNNVFLIFSRDELFGLTSATAALMINTSHIGNCSNKTLCISEALSTLDTSIPSKADVSKFAAIR